MCVMCDSKKKYTPEEWESDLENLQVAWNQAKEALREEASQYVVRPTLEQLTRHIIHYIGQQQTRVILAGQMDIETIQAILAEGLLEMYYTGFRMGQVNRQCLSVTLDNESVKNNL